MEKDTLPINPAVLRWARERACYTLEEASQAFRNISAWEGGTDAPTYPQLEQLAEKFKCPVAAFFFPSPPDVPNVEASFRTLTPNDYAEIPRGVQIFVRRGQAMQINLAELNDGRNPADRLITKDIKLSANSSLKDIASEVRGYLGISMAEQASWKSPEVALEAWRDAFSRVGIYVFKDAFRTEGYCGFCLYDDQFPIVYINNSSTKTRQIFTLFHELGHLLFHTSGIDVDDDSFIRHLPVDSRNIEVICNGLAACVLVPDDDFDGQLRGRKADRVLAGNIAEYFAVSREVIYRKFLDRGLINASEYSEAASFWASQRGSKTGGGNYYNSHFSYLGAHYVDLAIAKYHQGRFDEIKLAEYLNIKPKNLPAFEAKFGGRF